MTITALPTPPSRNDADTFSDRADAFLAALPGFVTEVNALASAMGVAFVAGINTVSTGVATDLFEPTGGAGLYRVHAYVSGSPNYHGVAYLSWDGTAAVLLSQSTNSGNFSFSFAAGALNITQQSGSTKNVSWSYNKQGH